METRDIIVLVILIAIGFGVLFLCTGTLPSK